MKSLGKGPASLFAGTAHWIEDRSIRRRGDSGYLIKSGWFDTQVYRVDAGMKHRYVTWMRILYASLLPFAAACIILLLPFNIVGSYVIGPLVDFLAAHESIRADGALLYLLLVPLATLVPGLVIYLALRLRLRRYPTAMLREWHHAPRTGHDGKYQQGDDRVDPDRDHKKHRGAGERLVARVKGRIERQTVLRRSDDSYLVRYGRIVYRVDAATKDRYLTWAVRIRVWLFPPMLALALLHLATFCLYRDSASYMPPLLLLLMPILLSLSCPHLRSSPTAPLREWWFPDPPAG